MCLLGTGGGHGVGAAAAMDSRVMAEAMDEIVDDGRWGAIGRGSAMVAMAVEGYDVALQWRWFLITKGRVVGCTAEQATRSTRHNYEAPGSSILRRRTRSERLRWRRISGEESPDRRLTYPAALVLRAEALSPHIPVSRGTTANKR